MNKVMNKTFFFYDLETSGLKAREDRIMQFAGQRTDMDLNKIGDPVNILIKITDDALPSPGAINVTGITPQQTLMDGISEAEFCKFITEEVFVPETIAVGYNTVRFDDEFMRAILWRNFYDPYEWEWKDGRSRWDMLDVVRLVRALRPEGINWPFRDDGVPTNRLELITKLNGLEHTHAHDALSDVYATIAVARLIKDKQPKMFNYLLKMRDKREVAKLVNLEDKKPFVYASGRYANEFNKTTVVFPLTSGRHGNVLVCDLRYEIDELLKPERGTHLENDSLYVSSTGDAPGGGPLLSVSEVGEEKARQDPLRDKQSAGSIKSIFPVVKELCLNKCPAVAPIGVLDVGDGWKKIGLTREQVEENLSTLLRHPEFAEQMRTQYENHPEFPPSPEPEAAIYDGFLNDQDKAKVAVIRNTDKNRLADLHPEFDDERLPELLLHYKGRNYPETLSESEMEQYEAYRQERLKKQAPRFMQELEKISDDFLKEELLLYMQSLL